MSSRLKIFLWILMGLLLMYAGVSMTGKRRVEQGAKIQSSQQSLETNGESDSGALKRKGKSNDGYNTDLLKKSLGGDQ